MAIESGNKPSAAAQVDYSKLRSPQEKDNLEISSAGRALLALIEESARPKELAELFPRIVNRMAELWRKPQQMNRYFEELLTSNRLNRKGFPLGVIQELCTLKDYYQTKVYPVQRGVWE